MDNETNVEQLEIVASYIVAKIKGHAKCFGGDYRIWLSDSLPGQKLRVDVWYNHATPGVSSLLASQEKNVNLWPLLCALPAKSAMLSMHHA